MLERALDRFDRFQKRHALLGFPLAVRRKYSEDKGGYLAATITYYGFFSFFPLLLVLVTVLGYVLEGNPSLQDRVVGSVLGQLPVVGNSLNHHSLEGNGFALAVGIVVCIWTGMGVCLAAENAMSTIWKVPRTKRPGFVASRGRALGLLLVLGGGLLLTTIVAGAAAATTQFGIAAQIGAVAASVVVNFLVFWLAFRLLTPGHVGWRRLRGGAAAAAIGYVALQLVGSLYVTHVLKSASNVYGTFALVIGMLSWIYLTATVVLLAAEGNVVASYHLWPQDLRGEPATATPAAPESGAARPDEAMPDGARGTPPAASRTR
jgi:YihY family inner membrane protein